MSREAFDTAMAALPPEQRYGLGAQLAWPIWQAARAAALEEAAKACESEAENWRGEQSVIDFRLCAARIRALKEPQ